MSPVRVLLATRNAQKLVELRRILAGSDICGVQVVGLDDVRIVAGDPGDRRHLRGKRVAKARDAAAGTGLATVADDSGLAVDALNGMPGVLSARWAGRHGDDAANLQLVLDQLADVPGDRRGAAFICAAALVVPPGVDTSGTETVVRGDWRGTLTRAARGRNGFGYDPIFVPDGRSAYLRRARAGREGCLIAPWPGAACPAARAAGAAYVGLPAVVTSAHDLHDLANRQLVEECGRSGVAEMDASG